MFEGLVQPMHLLVLLVVALLFFGPSKLGDFGKGLGNGIRHFKDALKDDGQKTDESSSSSTKAPEQ